MEEQVLTDPFDYDAEDRLIDAWLAAPRRPAVDRRSRRSPGTASRTAAPADGRARRPSSTRDRPPTMGHHAPCGRTAFRVYRAHPLAIAGIAAVVFAPLALLDAFGSAQAENLFNTGGGNVALGVIVLAGTSLLTAGSSVGAGLMDSFVVAEFGIDQPRPFRESLRSLPAGRLVVLDITVAVIVAVGTVFGALPGLAAFTLLCLAGPLLVRGGLDVRGDGAIRRSHPPSSARHRSSSSPFPW